MSGGVKRWTVSEIERENFEPHAKGFVLASDHEREVAELKERIEIRDMAIDDYKKAVTGLTAARDTVWKDRDVWQENCEHNMETIAQKDRVIAKYVEFFAQIRRSLGGEYNVATIPAEHLKRLDAELEALMRGKNE